ncbi:MAG TPA: hypothetical protein DCQ83_04340, partial [Fibrobacteres bacterium]|nr:hypothetical protein [Fibrobacterota bacterium]
MQSIPSTFSSSTFRRFRVFAMAFFLAGGLLRVNASAGPAEQLFQAAQKQYQSGDVNKAVSTLQQALASKSDYVDALVLLGSCYVELGEFDKAVDPYRRAAQASPNDRGILQGYQTALEGAGQQEPQVAVLRTLFFQNPTNEAMGGKYLSLLESVGPTRFSKEYAGL